MNLVKTVKIVNLNQNSEPGKTSEHNEWYLVHIFTLIMIKGGRKHLKNNLRLASNLLEERSSVIRSPLLWMYYTLGNLAKITL